MAMARTALTAAQPVRCFARSVLVQRVPRARPYAKASAPRVTKAVTARIQELVDKLNTYRDAYFNQSTSLVTDADYDALVKEVTSPSPLPHLSL